MRLFQRLALGQNQVTIKSATVTARSITGNNIGQTRPMLVNEVLSPIFLKEVAGTALADLSRRNHNYNNGSMLVKKFWHSQFNSKIKLSQDEILEITHEINREFPLTISTTQPELVILPVDPYHLYAYWNLGKNLNAHWNVNNNKQQTENTIKAAPENNLTLRIYSRPGQGQDPEKQKIWFDIPISTNQTQQRVSLPSYETTYSAAIGKRYADDKFVVFAYSNIITVPFGKTTSSQPVKKTGKNRALPQAPSNITQIAPKKISHPVIQEAKLVRDSLTQNVPNRNNTTSPELDKGLEISLKPEQNQNKQHQDIAPRYYDETLVEVLEKVNFNPKNKNKSNTTFNAQKENSTVSHFAASNPSGQRSSS